MSKLAYGDITDVIANAVGAADMNSLQPEEYEFAEAVIKYHDYCKGSDFEASIEAILEEVKKH